MSYINVHGEEVENEYEEKLINKYKDKYRCVRRIFPNAYKLPENEIEKMCHIIRYEGETYDEAEELLEKYIDEHQKEWKENYLTEKENTSQEQNHSKPSLWDYMVKEFKQDGQDVLYGMDRALSGMSLGAYDWLKRKTGLGFDEEEYMAEKEKQGTDLAAKIGGGIAEIGGSAIGGGGGIVKGLSKLGLKGLKLVAAAGGLEGTVTGITSSDTLAELPENMLINGTVGAALGGLSDEVMKFGGKIIKPFIKTPKDISTSSFSRYVQNHADDEVMEFVPSIRQFMSYAPDSTYNINPAMTSDMAKDILLARANQSNINVGGMIDHYLGKRGRDKYVRTLKNTLEGPDVTYQKIKQDSRGNNVLRECNVKKYNGNDNIKKQPFLDFIVKQDGNLYTKFSPDHLDYPYKDLLKQKDTVENMSFHSKLVEAEGTYPLSTSNRYITVTKPVVNPKLKNFFELYQNSTPYQQTLLGQALENSTKKTSRKVGSLDSVYKMNQSLDDMMNTKQFNNRALQETKQSFDDVIKPYKENAIQSYMPFDDTRNTFSGFSGSLYPMWEQNDKELF